MTVVDALIDGAAVDTADNEIDEVADCENTALLDSPGDGEDECKDVIDDILDGVL